MGSLAISKTKLAAAVANGATVKVPYPVGQTQAKLTGTTGGSVVIADNNRYPQGTGALTVAFTFGASDITITNNSGETWPVGANMFAGFGETTINGSYNLTNPKKVQDFVDNYTPPSP